jgi:hypothetical protein
MRRTVLLMCAVAGAAALGGCVGYIPVPAGPQVVYQQPAQPRYHRDRDRDGVPDRYDRRPNNPYRY